MSTLLHFSVASLFLLCRTGEIVSSQNSDSSYFFYQQAEYPRDCKEARDVCSTQRSSGIILIKPDGYHKPFEVYCNNEVDTGGWTVIQRRQDGSVSFQRNWLEYKHGFGFLSQEFWLGNEKLSYLTNQNAYELQINITYSNGLSSYALYSLFRISDEFSNYTLTSLGLYSGTVDFTTCPTNRKYRNCICETTCDNPQVCVRTCSEDELCICPNGFYIEGEDCIPQEECGCFIEGNIIPEGGFHMTSDCSRRCSCSAGQLACDDDYQCSPNAVCEYRDGLHKCYCNAGYTGDGVTCTSSSPPIDCLDVFYRGNTDSGVYNIKPTTWSGSPFEVYCNMTDGGGWTVFQRRVDGSVDFHVYWNNYKNGFGSPNNELWLGNDKIFSLTNQRRYQLRIDFVNRYGAPYYAKFNFFRINNEANKYRLTVGTYSDGDAGDSLTISGHNNQDFSTRDRDNDDSGDYHYASRSDNGAWWWGDCYRSNCRSKLNGRYSSNSFRWYTLPGSYYYIKFTEMKIRPV